MRKISLLIFFPILLSLCSSKHYEREEKKTEYDSLFTVQLVENLTKAYSDSSLDLLDTFLVAWENNVKPKKLVEIDNEVEKNIYQVYTEFYNPYKIGRIGEHAWSDSIYFGLNNLIIQNNIRYKVGDYKTRQSDKEKFLKNFRPELSFPNNPRILYLTQNYDSCLNIFLKNEYVPLGHENIMTPAYVTGESFRRQNFLSNKIWILYGHWGGYWHLETHPEVEYIEFNEKLNKAFLRFRLGYQGGEAEFIKTGGKWKMISSEMTWIE